MPTLFEQNRAALLQAKVDRAVAQWEGVVPPHMLEKLRRMAHEFYSTDPMAVRVLDRLACDQMTLESHVHRTAPPAGEPSAMRGARKA